MRYLVYLLGISMGFFSKELSGLLVKEGMTTDALIIWSLSVVLILLAPLYKDL